MARLRLLYRPQGYVFTELSKITHGDIMACEKMAEWLVEKLKRPEASTKWKVLLVIKQVRVCACAGKLLAPAAACRGSLVRRGWAQVSRTGRPEFRRHLQRHADAIKACLRE